MTTPSKDAARYLERHFTVKLTGSEMKAMAQMAAGFIEWMTKSEIKPPETQTRLVLQALATFSRAMDLGPDLVTVKN